MKCATNPNARSMSSRRAIISMSRTSLRIVPELVIVSDAEHLFIRPANIIYARKDANHTILHLTNRRKYRISTDIKEVIKKLSVFDFFKTTSPYLIVNQSFIKQITKSGLQHLVLNNGEELSIAPEFQDSFLYDYAVV